MTMTSLEDIARALVADGKGILAADETARTLTRRFNHLAIESTPDSRRDYREMFFRTPGVAAFIGGVILQDETIRQTSATGERLVDLLIGQGIIPGIKVDESTTPLAGAPGELITDGLDGLRDRLEEYREMGARFAKWRAVINIGPDLPTARCIQANAHALARYAALCQEQGIVPIVEPEVMMTGTHSIERCEEVTGRVLHAVFDALFDQGVRLEGMLLKPNMIVAGQSCDRQPSVEEVASATLRTLRRHVPPAVPGIVFLSGGQDHVQATEHLDAINRQEGAKPWKLSFSYGRALQDEAMAGWAGRSENLATGQRAFYRRAQCDAAAALGRYGNEMESEAAFT
jgi:fructose-bisphosphate aldolase class I